MSAHAKGPVLIMAGGTGGHIFPGLAVAEQLRDRGVDVVWLGAEGGMETRVVPGHGIALHTVPVSGLRGKGWAIRLRAPWMLLRAGLASLALMRRLRPRAVLSMGGYVAGPGGVAAWLLRRPLLIHEQNGVAGVTNRLLSRLASRVLTGFPQVLKNAEWVGNPVRAAIAALPVPAERMAAQPLPPRLLVLGGSLGARALNALLPQALALLPVAQRPQIVHQAGRDGCEAAVQAYAEAGVRAEVHAFLDDMAARYAWADLVVCRAGALTIAELTAAGLGAILVPFPHAVDDHQTRNGATLVEAGAAELVQERELDPERLAERLRELLADPSRLRAMAMAARSLAKPDAARRIADVCMEVAA